MAKFVSGKLNLAGLKHVILEKKGKSGMVKGIFIPIEANNLFFSKKNNVYLDLIAFELKEKQDNATHLVKQSFSKEIYDKMTDEERKETAILGNLNVDVVAEAKNNNAAEGKTLKEEDDLPF